jgi:hypothetical protein
MKTRQGFVSNSSSSSFVLLTTEENHQKILKSFTEEQQVTLNEIMKTVKLGNIALRIFQQLDVQGYNNPEMDGEERDLYYDYQSKIQESEIIYSNSIDG